jgi:hypothetical protein
VEAADQTFAAETAADGLDAQIPPASVIETKPVSPVIILDEIVFLVAPDTPLNNRAKTTAVVSASSAGISEDNLTENFSVEAITDGEDRIKNNSGETADGSETTMPPPPPEITDIEQASY